MKKDNEKPAVYALDKEVPIMSQPGLSAVGEQDELLVFVLKANLSTALLSAIMFSVLLCFISGSMLLLFLFNIILLAAGFIWNYRYNFHKKPFLKVNRIGITYKQICYPWHKIGSMICAEGYDAERSTYDTVYIKFKYNNTTKTISIQGLSRSEEEIIHYIHAFRGEKR